MTKLSTAHHSYLRGALLLTAMTPLSFLVLVAQPPSFRAPVVVTAAPNLLPPSSQSDASAIATFTNMIEATGGMAAWRGIRSAKIRLSIAPNGNAQTSEALMLDDWTSDSIRYRRGNIGMKKTPLDHLGQTSFYANTAGVASNVPEFDQARVLAGSLPSAAAEIILRKNSYLVKQSAGIRCTQDVICVDVYRQTGQGAPFSREQEWLISRTSGLPTTVDLLLPNVMGTRPIYEEFQFQSMISVNGVQIPRQVVMRHPSGTVSVRTVKSFTTNPRFDTAAFDKEITQ